MRETRVEESGCAAQLYIRTQYEGKGRLHKTGIYPLVALRIIAQQGYRQQNNDRATQADGEFHCNCRQ